MKRKEERLEYIDIAKGIAILLVVVGHTVRRGDPVNEDIVRGLIFSFHMPLFSLCLLLQPDYHKTHISF